MQWHGIQVVDSCTYLGSNVDNNRETEILKLEYKDKRNFRNDKKHGSQKEVKLAPHLEYLTVMSNQSCCMDQKHCEQLKQLLINWKHLLTGGCESD